MPSEAAHIPQMTAFPAKVVREVMDEFPHLKSKVERLIREKKIRVIEETDKVSNNVNRCKNS